MNASVAHAWKGNVRVYATLGVGAVSAKLASTLVSMTVAYIGHRFWSFSHRSALRGHRGYLLFALINGLTLLLGLAGVAVVRYAWGQESALLLQLTNVATIAIGTVIRYVSYRRWVFPERVEDPTEPTVASVLTHQDDEPQVSRPTGTRRRPAMTSIRVGIRVRSSSR